MTFRLWHLLVLVTFSTFLTAVYQVSLNLGILTTISVFPALATLAAVPRLRTYFANCTPSVPGHVFRYPMSRMVAGLHFKYRTDRGVARAL